jgi:hypothetical protein
VTNLLLSERTARDIDGQVEKVLSDLGQPEPPLRLEVVRELLHLDRAYYSTGETGVLQETVHRIRVAGKQVLRRPSLLLDVVRKCDIKALWLPDRKRILIDAELPEPKQRWGEGHEIGHSTVPWHEAMAHGDHRFTLSLSCQQQLEAEANYAAGRLLFLRNRFVEEIHASEVTFDRVRELSKLFGNTITSTLWRAIESLDVPAIGLVSIRPHEVPSNGEVAVRHFIRSRAFAERFDTITDLDLFRVLGRYCSSGRGPLGKADVVLPDTNGIEHVFRFESFDNYHDTLTLGLYQGLRPCVVS